MNNVFVYCEIEGTQVADVSLELLTKGRKLANQLGCQLEAIAAGNGLAGIEKQVLPYGVDKLHVFDAPGLFPYTSLPHTSILVNLFKEEKPQICLMGATVIGRDLGPRVSSALTSGLTADCTQLEIGAHEDKKAGITYENLLYQIRPAFGGNIVATIVNPEHRPQMATVREGVMKKEILDENYIIEAAKEYPNVQFSHATGTKAHTEGLDNFHNAFASIYDGRYLAGIVAGMKLNEMIANGDITEDQAKMGYVGAYTYAEVMSGYTSFFLGARSVCPSVTMDVTFTGSWYDETAEKEAANKLIEGGCVLISQHADSMGAPTACETAGVPNVSYNGSTEAACPNTFLVSSRVNWEPYFEYAIKCVADGTPIDTDWCGTLETGSVELSDLGAAVADGTAEAVEAAKADLIAGKAHVYDITTFTVDGKTLDSYEADIDTDPDYTPDHEVVSDGYFHESDVAFRSAPYFNVRIDGINLLDEQY